MNCYRVWMKDDYCRLINAQTESEARAMAIEMTKKDCNNVAMSKQERTEALTIARIEKLNQA